MDEWKLFCLLEGKEADNKLRYSIEVTSNLLQFHQYIYILRTLALLLHRPHYNDFIQIISPLRHYKKYIGEPLD
jgi:hypothetical protein